MIIFMFTERCKRTQLVDFDVRFASPVRDALSNRGGEPVGDALSNRGGEPDRTQ
jgi:hypothetical protein